MENEMQTAMMVAMEQSRRDSWFRHIIDSSVNEALRHHGPVNPESPDRDAYAIAMMATSTLLHLVYKDDAELNRLREENERLRNLKLSEANLSQRLFVASGEVKG